MRDESATPAFNCSTCGVSCDAPCNIGAGAPLPAATTIEVTLQPQHRVAARQMLCCACRRLATLAEPPSAAPDEAWLCLSKSKTAVKNELNDVVCAGDSDLTLIGMLVEPPSTLPVAEGQPPNEPLTVHVAAEPTRGAPAVNRHTYCVVVSAYECLLLS